MQWRKVKAVERIGGTTSALRILFGTTTGMAAMAAEDMRDAARRTGFPAEAISMENARADVFDRLGRFVICVSTCGVGDIPYPSEAFFDELDVRRPALAGVEYGLVALGDRAYGETFCRAGREFDALLQELGATRVGEPLFHDAGDGSAPETAAVDWLSTWLRTDRS